MKKGKLKNFYINHPVIFTVCLAFAIVLIMEILGRHSLVGAVGFLFNHPVRYAANMSIVLLTLSVSFLIPKRSALLTTVSAVWLSLAVVNCGLLFYRTTPLGIIDIIILPACFTVINVYMDPWQIVLVLAATVAIIAGLILLFFKTPSYKVVWKNVIVFVLASTVAMFAIYDTTVHGHEKEREDSFSNIADAYGDYGFAYCFATSTFDRGINEPNHYSRNTMKGIIKGLKKETSPRVKPDIVMVQLESFFDVAYLNDVEYNEDPIPVFRALKDNYTSGFLTVPSVGAGTANTEFEVLSGMSLDFFGMGEYPYKTILKEEACETVVTNLKEIGYTCHAIHNNIGSFYGRNEVFAQLGFDFFTSIEYMNGVEYNPIGWAKDNVLTGEIEKALDSSDDPQFIFTITVQGHGRYQRGIDSEEAESLDIEWEEDPNDEEAFAYYMSQLRETDEFIGELVNMLQKRDKPAVLVLYGDHLPNFDIGTDELENGDIFQTEYVVWDNIGLSEKDKNISAYQLSADVLGKVGIKQGILMRYHQQRENNAKYYPNLELLEYDMLYGDFYCYGGSNPYVASNLQMGVDTISISGGEWKDGVLTLTGENFTEWSTIVIDGRDVDTVFIDASHISAETDAPENGATVTVQQISSGYVLSETEPSIWQ